MADLTAHFGADFSKFYDAVEQATAKLVDFEAGSEHAQRSLDRMTETFSGKRLIQEADVMARAIEDLGGTSKMTEAELARVGSTLGEAVAKMDAIGMPVPDRMRELAHETANAGKEVSALGGIVNLVGGYIASAFSIQAIVGFAKSAIDAAGDFKKMSDQLGMTTDEVQKLKFIAEQSSVDVGTLTSAAQGLQAALGSGNTGVIGAIEKLGINMADFLKLSTYDQLVQIGKGLDGMADQNMRATREAEIFGNKWKEIGPAITAEMDKVGNRATLMTKETIKAMDAGMAKYNEYMTTAKVVVASTLQGFGQLVDMIVKIPEKVGWVAQANEQLETATLSAADATGISAEELAKYYGAVDTTTLALGESIKAEDTLAGKMRASYRAQATQEEKDRADAIKKATDEAKKAAEELGAWADAYTEVESAGSSWQDRLGELDPQLVAHIESLLQAGVKAELVAKAYDLSAQNLADFQSMLKDANDQLDRGNAIMTEGARLDTALTTQQIANTGSRLQIAIAAINQESELYRQSMEEKGLWNDELAAKEDAVRQARIQGVMLDKHILEQGTAGTRDALQERADIARATADEMIAHSERYSTEAIAAQIEVARQAEMAALDMSHAAQTVADAHASAAAQVVTSWSQAMDAVRAGQGTMSGSTNAFPATRNQIQASYDDHRYYGPVKNGGPDWAALGIDPTAIDFSSSTSPWLARAAGGPVSAGSPYMVGENGPELYVPDRNGTIVPNGATGGGSVVANIYVNGTGQDVARIINAELTRMMRVGRKWPSV